jgi:FkbM family methyltransferase
MFYKLLNAYTRRFPFPKRGLKYFLRVAKPLGLADRHYSKKLHGCFYMNLNPGEHIQQQLLWYGHYEKEIGDLLLAVLGPEDVFLDTGANIGYFSLLAAAKKPGAKIFAFEPSSLAFEKLKQHIRENNFQNIMAIQAAAGDDESEADLFLSAPENSGMSSLAKPENYMGRHEKVSVIRIDDWFHQVRLKKISVVKIDVEGFELAVLKGMQKVIQDFQPLIISEINQQTLSAFGCNPQDIFTFMGKQGYEKFVLTERGNLISPVNEDPGKTINVLFIHPDKKQNYPQLFK